VAVRGASLHRLAEELAQLLTIAPTFSHDIYHELRNENGMLCCGGDPVSGDYSALPSDAQRGCGCVQSPIPTMDPRKPNEDRLDRGGCQF
jgi:hypothetical protein